MFSLPQGELIMSGEGHKDWLSSVDFSLYRRPHVPVEQLRQAHEVQLLPAYPCCLAIAQSCHVAPWKATRVRERTPKKDVTGGKELKLGCGLEGGNSHNGCIFDVISGEKDVVITGLECHLTASGTECTAEIWWKTGTGLGSEKACLNPTQQPYPVPNIVVGGGPGRVGSIGSL